MTPILHPEFTSRIFLDTIKAVGTIPIVRPPGWIVAWLGEQALGPESLRILRESIADMREEYFRALAAGRLKDANRARLLFHVSIARTLVIDYPVRALLDYLFGTIFGMN